MKLIQLLQQLNIEYSCIDYNDLDLEIIIIHDKILDNIGRGRSNTYPIFKAELNFSNNEIQLTIIEEFK